MIAIKKVIAIKTFESQMISLRNNCLQGHRQGHLAEMSKIIYFIIVTSYEHEGFLNPQYRSFVRRNQRNVTKGQ